MSNQAKAWWKAVWRLLRVNRRETEKASTDALIYGSGYVRVDSSGEVRHIPWQALQKERGK